MPLKFTDDYITESSDSLSHLSPNELMKKLKQACDHDDEIRMLLEFLQGSISSPIPHCNPADNKI